MRHRESGEFVTNITTKTSYGYPCETSPAVSTYGAGVTGEVVTTNDEVTPNFFRRIRAGEIIVNGYNNTRELRLNTMQGIESRESAHTTCPDGQEKFVRWDGPHLTYLCELDPAYGSLEPYWLFTQEEVDMARSIAATKAWANVQAAEAQFLVTVAEGHKTLAMLRRPLGNFLKYLSYVNKNRRKGRLSRLMTLGKYLSNEWLTYRYGVRPLLLDIDQTLTALGKDQKSGWIRANGSHTIETSSTTPKNLLTGWVRYYWDHFSTHRYTAKCGLMFEGKVSTDDYLGATLSNIPSAAWELIPYSFVVDWFANVGTLIQSIIPYLSANTKGHFTTHTHVISVQRTNVSAVMELGGGASYLSRQPSGVESLYFTYKQRDPGIPPPSLTRKFTPSNIPVDWRVVDSLALIMQKLKV